MEVLKSNMPFGPKIALVDEAKWFEIQFGGNLDLYWSIYNLSYDEELTYETFVITKENYYIYELFLNLYESIKNGDIYDENETNFLISSNNLEEMKERERIHRLFIERTQKKLFIDNSIIWYSDDGDYADDEIVRISKVDEEFLLEFFKIPKVDKDKSCYSSHHHFGISIRFRNSGCRYQPFELPFMKMYNKLCKYDPDMHQIHIEEYEYVKKMNMDKNS